MTATRVFKACVLLSVAMTAWSCSYRPDEPEVTDAPEDDGIDVTRSEWGARSPQKTTRLYHPISFVFIHHTETPTCSSQTTCSARVRSIQDYHMDDEGWDDIGYNFLIGGDGKVYEGRGWDTVGAQVKYYNHISIGIAIIGNYTSVKPNDAALDAAKNLIDTGVDLGNVNSYYKLRGHRDVRSTDCPGDSLYAEIKEWDNY